MDQTVNPGVASLSPRLVTHISWILIIRNNFYSPSLPNLLIHEGHCQLLAKVCTLSTGYRNVPKFSDSQVWAKSVDPDQTAPMIRVYTVCQSVCIFWTHYRKFLNIRTSEKFAVITLKVEQDGFFLE